MIYTHTHTHPLVISLCKREKMNKPQYSLWLPLDGTTTDYFFLRIFMLFRTFHTFCHEHILLLKYFYYKKEVNRRKITAAKRLIAP